MYKFWKLFCECQTIFTFFDKICIFTKLGRKPKPLVDESRAEVYELESQLPARWAINNKLIKALKKVIDKNIFAK